MNLIFLYRNEFDEEIWYDRLSNKFYGIEGRNVNFSWIAVLVPITSAILPNTPIDEINFGISTYLIIIAIFLVGVSLARFVAYYYVQDVKNNAEEVMYHNIECRLQFNLNKQTKGYKRLYVFGLVALIIFIVGFLLFRRMNVYIVLFSISSFLIGAFPEFLVTTIFRPKIIKEIFDRNKNK